MAYSIGLNRQPGKPSTRILSDNSNPHSVGRPQKSAYPKPKELPRLTADPGTTTKDPAI